MKHITYGLGGCITAILIIMVIVTINGQMTRQKEVTTSLTSAVDQTVDNLISNKTYTIEGKDEFVSDLMENLLYTIENNSDIEVQIMSADYDKGLIGIRVIEHYKNPNQKKGTVHYDKIVLLDAIDYSKQFIVQYREKNNVVISEYTISIGQKMPVIKNYSNKWKLKTGDNTYSNKDYTNDDISKIVDLTTLQQYNSKIIFVKA